MKLAELRNEIDNIDRNILDLLNKRAVTAKNIGEWKRENNLPIYVPEREKALLEKLFSINNGPLNNTQINDIYQIIIKSCRELE